MKKYLLIMALALAVAFCLGCNDDSSSTGSTTSSGAPTPGAPTTPGMPTPGAPTPGAPTPGGMPGAPTTPGMPSASGMPGAMGPDMGGAPAEEAAPAEDNSPKTLEAKLPNATINRDAEGEIRSFYNPDAVKKTRTTGLTEHQSRQVALDFIRANYYYFDTMSFEFRNEPGVYKGGNYHFKWVQIIRETKKTGNTIDVVVNPMSGEVVKYSSTRNKWTN